MAAEKAKDPLEEDLIKGIETALLYLQEDWSETEADLDTLVAQGEITYDLLWALFPPNTYVQVYHEGTEQELVLHSRGLTYQCTPAGNFAALKCDLINNDGRMFGLAVDIKKIDQYAGSCQILSLPVVPLELYPEREKLREHAIRRGKQFAGITRYFCECSGPATVDRSLQIEATAVKITVCLINCSGNSTQLTWATNRPLIGLWLTLLLSACSNREASSTVLLTANWIRKT